MQMTNTQSEKYIENQIKKWLDEHHHWYFKVHGGSFQKSGVPDIIACIKGKFVAIEVKKPNGGIISKLQEIQIKKIQDSQGIAGVARSVDEFLDILRHGGLI